MSHLVGRIHRVGQHPHRRRVVTADGGYFSQGGFYWEPSDTVTLITKWCYSDGIITSHSVRHSTTIPKSLDPRFTTTQSLVKGGAVLDLYLNGDYDSGVLNNVGVTRNWLGSTLPLSGYSYVVTGVSSLTLEQSPIPGPPGYVDHSSTLTSS